MKKLLITGGCGFIGSHTCIALIEKGFEVILLDSFINSKTKTFKNLKIYFDSKLGFKNYSLKLIVGDIRDEYLLNKIFKDELKNGMPIDAVIHFAGLKSVPESVSNPLNYWEINVGGTLKLLKSMQVNNCRNFIFSSSASIYGNSTEEFLKENTKKNPNNPYANSKLAIEQILRDLFNQANDFWNIISLRYFNPAGAHHSLLIGEDSKKSSKNILPLLCKAANALDGNIFIYGNDWPTEDGTCIRDYIHICDLADGHLEALIYLQNKKNIFMPLNLGTGIGTSVLDLVNTFNKVNKCSISFNFLKKREGDVARLVACNKKAIETLEWLPKKDIEDICRDAFNWYQVKI